MIRTIKGIVLSIESDGIIVMVSGFGLLIHLAEHKQLIVGKQITLATHMVIRQGGPELYGFIDPKDRQFFELILTVSGFGPKTALSLLRRSARAQLESAIAKHDIEYLTRVIGIGKKAAGKLIVELAEKLKNSDTTHTDVDTEVFDMLVALGYTEREARKALDMVPENIVGSNKRLKTALGVTLK